MESIFDLWKEIKPSLHEELGDIAYNVWVETIVPVAMNSSEALFRVPSSIHRDIVVVRFVPIMRRRLKELTGHSVEVRILVEGEMDTGFAIANDADYEFSFDTFIVGSSNRFAHAAALAVSQNPGGAYNPLFIYGQSGLGKTHLLCAIRDYVLRQNPKLKVMYIKGDQFTNELIEAIGNAEQMQFRQKYRYVDVLLMDDIQFIGGKVSTEEEFFHTFNTLHQEHKQIVLTSDRPPREIKTLEERLRSRFESGLLADIQPPEFETRVAIIKRKAKLFNMEMSDNIAEFIADKLKTNIRQLEGVVKKMNIISMVENERPSLTMAHNAIKDVLSDVQPIPVTIERVVEEVARSFEVQPEDIFSDRRSQPLSQARQVAMYCVRSATNLSYEAIGKEFGNRDHTTVIYAVQKIEVKMRQQPDFKARIEDILKNIETQ